MDSITLHPDISLSYAARAVALLDNYFYFGGEQTQVIAAGGSYVFCRKVAGRPVSLAEKVLKILSFLLFPLVLIALAFRALLHMTYKASFVYFNSDIPDCCCSFLATSSPTEVASLAEHVEGIFQQTLPKRYLTAIPNLTKSGNLESISFRVNWERVVRDSCFKKVLKSIILPYAYLMTYFPALCSCKKLSSEFASTQEKSALVREVISYLQMCYIHAGYPKTNLVLDFMEWKDCPQIKVPHNAFKELFFGMGKLLGKCILEFLFKEHLISGFRLTDTKVNILFE
ncbi:DUF648 domain-containing protein [Candidatus Chlamydia sanziniae]|uniref:Uncharacterized protein n=1 Tax=Candidatus Chlamydia sanziniae TaxID=1806891 RepID=A0A1A9HX01_9CHLA|nr:DUF648 domain-containing protein [Candidatus Chlamydia sanziniae]ANH78971.1 hypothetical protein Cs308_0801 [Candidatus Chlamydia sanziniae]